MRLADVPLVLPAAGKSSRMGSPKGLKSVGGRTWLELQCETFRRAGGQTVLLVLGYDHEAYRDAVCVPQGERSPTVQVSGCRVHVLENPLPELGPFSSLQAACLWITERPDFPAILFLPIDTPAPQPEVFRRLIKSFRTGVRIAVPQYQGAGGHPVLISREFAQHLLTLEAADPRSRLDYQIRTVRALGGVSTVAVNDPNVVMNLNDAVAWERYVSEHYADLYSRTLMAPSNSAAPIE